MTKVEKEKVNKRRRLIGAVVSRGGEKTVVVRVERSKMHPIYKKRYVVSKKYHAHDPEDKTVVGDVVSIEECRPMSKLKRWRVLK